MTWEISLMHPSQFLDQQSLVSLILTPTNLQAPCISPAASLQEPNPQKSTTSSSELFSSMQREQIIQKSSSTDQIQTGYNSNAVVSLWVRLPLMVLILQFTAATVVETLALQLSTCMITHTVEGSNTL